MKMANYRHFQSFKKAFVGCRPCQIGASFLPSFVFPKLFLASDVTTITFCRHIFTQGRYGLTGNHLAADRRRNATLNICRGTDP